ncbi:MAG: outer membrane lipoprotein-sorting protein [Gammaproteobacteria bacterium]
MKPFFKLAAYGVIALLSTTSYAETPEQKGLNIANLVDQHDQGWGDTSVSMKMVLRNRHGEESMRAIRIKNLEILDDGDKGLTIFDNPRDVKGTAFLSFSHVTKADDQWLYLPALKRVKRISSANKSGPFMGSQFSFEDIASFEVGKYSYKYLKDDKLIVADNTYEVFVIENYPLYEYSGYTRQVVWIDKKRYIPLKVEYYDRKNDLLKTLSFKEYKQYLGKYWRAHNQLMENHQTGKTTVLTFSDFKFQNGYSARDFQQTSLKRAR